ncbi:MAG: hypothetical protein WA947_02785 [Phormidesmis sp.]
MNQNFNQMRVRFPGLGCWIFVLGGAWLLGAIGLSGIVKSIFALVLFLVLTPVIVLIVARFWIKRNLVEGACPICDQSLTSIKNVKMACPNCTTQLMTTEEGFERFAPEGVIDVQAVDIQGSSVDLSSDDDGNTSATTIDVEVQRLPEGEG